MPWELKQALQPCEMWNRRHSLLMEILAGQQWSANGDLDHHRHHLLSLDLDLRAPPMNTTTANLRDVQLAQQLMEPKRSKVSHENAPSVFRSKGRT